MLVVNQHSPVELYHSFLDWSLSQPGCAEQVGHVLDLTFGEGLIVFRIGFVVSQSRILYHKWVNASIDKRALVLGYGPSSVNLLRLRFRELAGPKAPKFKHMPRYQ